MEDKTISPEKKPEDVESDSLFSESASMLPGEGDSSAPLPLGGLSEEETNDLNSLIHRLKAGDSDFQSDGNESKQIRFLENRLSHMGELILKFDNSLKILFELMRLFQRKSEILNHRIKELENNVRQDYNT
jgi:uncharacterized protein YdcH (DUF465 family)